MKKRKAVGESGSETSVLSVSNESPSIRDFGVVFVTCASVEEGRKLARGMVENRLAACVNMVQGVESFFWWEGKVDHGQEVLLIIKTRRGRFEALRRYVAEHHSYQVPEVIMIALEKGHPPYVQWMVDSLRG